MVYGEGHARKRLLPILLSALALCLLGPVSARAADPGRWVETGFSQVPISYYQGVTSDPAGSLYFDGFTVGLWHTDPALHQEAGVFNAIPPAVAQREGYNHIGDLTWDAAEGGRLILPLECYSFATGNFCHTGSFGVADPQTLQWRYYVKLDPADILKAMWAEVSPDGELVWTSAGNDLLAYRTADINPGNAAPQGPIIHPVRRLIGAVPPSGITGATFYEGRLFLAGQDTGPFQIWSVDTATGERRLELERQINGESEGLDIFPGLGGILHWQIGPISFTGPPTYGSRVVLLHLVPANHPPDCSHVSASPDHLWPPNHRLQLVTIGGVTDPDNDGLTIAVETVTQDEASDVAGDGRTSPDWLAGPRSDQVWLRAERSGAGDGRVYEVAVKATDSHGATCTATVAVVVPHNH